MVNNASIENIRNLPDNPTKRIVWVVYNANMISMTESTIISIKGQEYFDKYVTVVASQQGRIDIEEQDVGAHIYFDPHLHSLIGNGYN